MKDEKILVHFDSKSKDHAPIPRTEEKDGNPETLNGGASHCYSYVIFVRTFTTGILNKRNRS